MHLILAIMAKKNKKAKEDNPGAKTDKYAENLLRQAFDSIDQVRSCWKPGLQALGPNSKYVSPDDSKKLGVSLDLDASYKQTNPNDSRWDYIFDYNKFTYFAEVHPADIGQCSEVIKKVNFLKAWLKDEGKAVAVTPGGSNPVYYWIPSGRDTIPRTSPKYKLCAQKGIIIGGPLKLK